MTNPNSRLEAFADGVFAIALTLLIIEIKIPHVHDIHSNKELWMAFAHSWPSWFAFMFSFVTILISWVNHSHISILIDKSSHQFTYANGLLLFSVIVLPFPTAAVAEFLLTDFAQPAITLYCGTSLLNNIAWNILQYASLHPKPIYKHQVILEKVTKNGIYMKAGFVVYSIAFLLSFWYPFLAFGIIGSSYLGWLIIGIAIKEEKMTT